MTRQLKVVLAVLALGACSANHHSVNRRTSVSAWRGGGTSRPRSATAIHLDASQRVVFVDGQMRLCSEPSPDGLGASSAGFGVSGGGIPAGAAGSVAATSASVAGSLGLRTQSITLMRDGLYRVCEAFLNGAIEPDQVVALLAKSQDLTAAMLAVEQLTGTVTAAPIVLASNATANASATVEAHAKALESATNREATAKAALASAEAAAAAADAAHAVTLKQRIAAQSALDGAAPNAADRRALEERVRAAEADTVRSALAAQRAANDVVFRQSLLKSATETVAHLSREHASVIATATSGANTNGTIGTAAARTVHDADATKAIAEAVQSIVTRVLGREYTDLSCLSMLSKQRDTSTLPIRAVCEDRLVRHVSREATGFPESAVAYDDTARSMIDLFEKDSVALRNVRQWLEGQRLPLGAVDLAISVPYRALRRRVLDELKLTLPPPPSP